MDAKAHHGAAHNSQKLKTAQVSIRSITDTWTVGMYSREYPEVKKEEEKEATILCNIILSK